MEISSHLWWCKMTLGSLVLYAMMTQKEPVKSMDPIVPERLLKDSTIPTWKNSSFMLDQLSKRLTESLRKRDKFWGTRTQRRDATFMLRTFQITGLKTSLVNYLQSMVRLKVFDWTRAKMGPIMLLFVSRILTKLLKQSINSLVLCLMEDVW